MRRPNTTPTIKPVQPIMPILKRKWKYVVLAILIVATCDYMGVFTHLLEIDYHTQFTYPLEVNMVEILHALKNGQKPAVDPLNQYNFRFKIENRNKCKSDDGREMADIVVTLLVKSAIGHRSQRDAIRKSWGFEKRFSDVEIRCVFILGEDPSNPLIQDDIDNEYKKHRDIVQSAFTDRYFNNTIKTMVAFNWVVKNCNKSQYILLVDDDYYVSMKNLLKFLRNPLDLPMGARQLRAADNEMYGISNDESLRRKRIFDGRLYGGRVFLSSGPLRYKPSKWHISLEEYPFSKYPPYVTAGAVALNYLALLDMHYTSLYTKHFRFDDIYMAILAKKAGIEPIHNENFHYWLTSYDRSQYSKVIAAHGHGNPNELVKIWEEQKSLGSA